jgi:Flp pilus assembly protein TadG
MRRNPSQNHFAANVRGSVAITFAIVLVPLLLGIAAAVDYARASQAQADLQSAVDATALLVGRLAIETGQRDSGDRARAAFDAGFKRTDGTTVTKFDVRQTDRTLVLDVNASVPLAFARILGRDSIEAKATAEVPLDVVTVEVALVLDNTGSMAANGKMAALKDAARGLIDTLQNASVVNTKAEIAIGPFATQVNVGAGSPAPSWVRFRATETDPKLLGVTAANWQGCIFDRDQNNDVRETLPTSDETLFPAAPCQYAGLLPVMPLTRDFAALRTAITNMNPTGNTNTGIGLAWGSNVLNPGAPLSATARAPGRYVKKHMIFLTDGLNTENRFTTDSAEIDKRTEKMCNEIRSSKNNITLHTIRVIDGNETLLRNCASSPDKYYSITDPSQLKPAFDAIAAQIVSLRLAR